MSKESKKYQIEIVQLKEEQDRLRQKLVAIEYEWMLTFSNRYLGTRFFVSSIK
jgi:hypothetical protein